MQPLDVCRDWRKRNTANQRQYVANLIGLGGALPVGSSLVSMGKGVDSDSEPVTPANEHRALIPFTGRYLPPIVPWRLAAWQYRTHPRLGIALKERQRGQPLEVIEHSWTEA